MPLNDAEQKEIAFDAGKRAAISGKSKLASPFKPGSPYDLEWRKGWQAGRVQCP